VNGDLRDDDLVRTAGAENRVGETLGFPGILSRPEAAGVLRPARRRRAESRAKSPTSKRRLGNHRRTRGPLDDEGSFETQKRGAFSTGFRSDDVAGTGGRKERYRPEPAATPTFRWRTMLRPLLIR